MESIHTAMIRTMKSLLKQWYRLEIHAGPETIEGRKLRENIKQLESWIELEITRERL